MLASKRWIAKFLFPLARLGHRAGGPIVRPDKPVVDNWQSMIGNIMSATGLDHGLRMLKVNGYFSPGMLRVRF